VRINNEMNRENYVFFLLLAIDRANGSWNETAMSYDCRTMLFKALHNMIEKYERDKKFL